MKFLNTLAVLCFAISLTSGCSTTSKEEKEAYFEEGKMEDQVKSWEKHGRY
ncbi:MAG: hypothetical protein V3V05_07410 [Pontiella sp.]